MAIKQAITSFILSSVFLSGCSLNGPQKPWADPAPLPPPQYRSGEFNQESLFDLLSAELAGQRQNYQLALDNYLKQARLTGDPAVAARATHIAQFMQAPDAMLEAALLWSKADPGNPEPYQLAASLLLHDGRATEALPLLEVALEQDASQTLALVNRQVRDMSPEQLDGYRSIIDRQLARDPDNSALLMTHALLLKAADEPQAASRTFRRIIELQPSHVPARIQLAELLRQQGKYSQALKLIQPALQRYPEQKALQMLNVQLQFQSGQVKTGRETAVAMLEQHNEDHELRFYLALLLLESGDKAAASHALKQLLTDGSSTVPHYYLGRIAEEDGNTAQALNHYQAVRDEEKLIPAYTRILQLLQQPADYPRIARLMEQARTSADEHAPRLYGLEAEWLNTHAQTSAAIALLDKALNTYTDNIDLLYTRAMLTESVDYSRMEADLRRILELEPENSHALNALGYTLLLHTERYEEAYKLIRQALELRPDDPAILDSMGWALYKLERYDDAVFYLERAFAQYPDAEVASHLAYAYQAQGHHQRALELLHRMLSHAPQNPQLLETLQALEP